MGSRLRHTLAWWSAGLKDGTFERDVSLVTLQSKPILVYTVAWQRIRGPPGVRRVLLPRRTQVTFWETLTPI